MAFSHDDKLRMIRGAKQFDSKWYRATYLAGDGPDPAEHFLAYGAGGNHDPGPDFSAKYYLETHPKARRRGANPLLHALNHTDPAQSGLDVNTVLYAADIVAQRGRSDLAVRLATRDLPPELAHTVHILHCNASLPDHEVWLKHLNAYLSARGEPGVELGSGDQLFDRLSAPAHSTIGGGPKVSVLMAAYEAKDTIRASVGSILQQSWRNLELIVVDDASTDGTWPILQKMAQQDSRMRVLRNRHNVGPFVSKNTALQLATGDWITGQDADEWSHPMRLARHLRAALEAGPPLRASAHSMLRMTPEGRFSQIRRIGKEVHDGVLQHCPVSPLFERSLLLEALGSWDCARFGADKEMQGRVAAILGEPMHTFPICASLSLDVPGSLTNNPVTGIHPDFGVTEGRQAYRQVWRRWQAAHLNPKTAYYAFPPKQRPYSLPELADVPQEHILENLSDFGLGE
jgi:hypothetical protein